MSGSSNVKRINDNIRHVRTYVTVYCFIDSFKSFVSLLFIGCGPILRLFSTTTGEHIQDVEISAISLEKPEGSIVDIRPHPFDAAKIILCFEEGRMIVWSYATNSIIENKVSSVVFAFVPHHSGINLHSYPDSRCSRKTCC